MSHRRQVLVIASAASFLVYLDVTVVNIAFPDIEAEFADTSRETLAWILAAYNITFAALLVPGGRISDRFGRKRLFGIGIVVFALASAGCAAAGDAGVLIAFRVLQAVGGAMLVPASQGLVLEAFPQEQRTTAISLWVAAGAVAVALGPPLGGLLVEFASWHWVFLINLPIAAGVLALGWGRLRESRDESTTRLPDPVGIGLSAAAVGALVLALVQGDQWGWTSTATLGSFAAFAVLTPLFVLRTRRALVPALDLDLFSSRAFSLANVASLAMGIAFYGLIFAIVLFMTTVWGYSAIEAGLALAPAPLVAALAAGIGGRTAEGASLLRRASAGILLFVAGSAWMATELEVARPNTSPPCCPAPILRRRRCRARGLAALERGAAGDPGGHASPPVAPSTRRPARSERRSASRSSSPWSGRRRLPTPSLRSMPAGSRSGWRRSRPFRSRSRSAPRR